MAIYDVQGNAIGTLNISATIIDYDRNVKGIAHRGNREVAPENTLPAFKLAKQNGFNYVECDVLFTSDNIPVLCHDDNIKSHSNSIENVYITQTTLQNLKQYDFSHGIVGYEGTKIPTFEEFIALCRNLSLHPYIEIKYSPTPTSAQVQSLIPIVKKYGMLRKVTWISFSDTILGYIKSVDASARLGFLLSSVNETSGDVTPTNITRAQNLLTNTNEVFIDARSTDVISSTYKCGLCMDANLPLEVWTVNTASTIVSMDPYISGVTSDNLIAGKVLYENSIT